jgi:hypothetical protein
MPVRLHLTVVLSLDCCPDERACWMDIVAGCSDMLLPASEEARHHAQVGQSDPAGEGHHHPSTGTRTNFASGPRPTGEQAATAPPAPGMQLGCSGQPAVTASRGDPGDRVGQQGGQAAFEARDRPGLSLPCHQQGRAGGAELCLENRWLSLASAKARRKAAGETARRSAVKLARPAGSPGSPPRPDTGGRSPACGG